MTEYLPSKHKVYETSLLPGIRLEPPDQYTQLRVFEHAYIGLVGLHNHGTIWSRIALFPCVENARRCFDTASYTNLLGWVLEGQDVAHDVNRHAFLKHCFTSSKRLTRCWLFANRLRHPTQGRQKSLGL